MKTRKFGIEEIVVLGLTVLMLLAWGCTETKYITIAPPTPSKQDEAKSKLQEIYQQQLAYRQNTGVFWPAGGIEGSAANPYAFLPIGVDFNCTNRYSYVFTVVYDSVFVCRATSGILDGDATTDVWTIDEKGSLVVVSDDTRS
ncbi:MAG TPA: hypothetical protein VNL73_00395 [Verrucomicrobiae bacterium]|nr:hypothetical protein [Verrucomicrobiae bacterium]